MMRFWFTIVALLTPMTAFALEKRVEFVCGTPAAGGSYYSETGVVTCEDEIGGAKTEITPDNKRVFCSYAAFCTPATPDVRQAILKKVNAQLKEKDSKAVPLTDWEQVTDDQANQAVMSGAGSELGRILERTDVSVMCMGGMTSNGQPDCPRVNDCVNNRGKAAALFWRVQPLNINMDPSNLRKSQGVILKQTGDGVPRGVTK